MKSASELYEVRTSSTLIINEEAILVAQDDLSRTINMVVGEGAIFALLFVLGAVWASRLLRAEEIRREREMSFMLAVTHELKTPIASIRLALDTMNRLDLSEEDRADLNSEARWGADRLERRINDILEATRLNMPDALVSSPFDLEEAIVETINQLSSSSKKFMVEFDSENFTNDLVEGDLKMWKLCFINLIENAEKYCPEDGLLRIRLESVGRKVVMTFKDNGPGIAAEYQKKVFDAFYRLDRDRAISGTGLGLHLVDRIVLMHGASIELVQTKTPGAKFVITWPR
jgi:signal transduction histidine kinase